MLAHIALISAKEFFQPNLLLLFLAYYCTSKKNSDFGVLCLDKEEISGTQCFENEKEYYCKNFDYPKFGQLQVKNDVF